MSNSSIWPIDKTLSDATTLGQSGPGSNGNERVLCIPQNSSITGASQSDCLMSYQDIRWWVGLSPQQRCSRCILRPQLNGMSVICDWIYVCRGASSPSSSSSSSSSSSRRADSTDSHDSVSPSVSGQNFLAASSVRTELMFVSFCWSGKTNEPMRRSPQENVAYEIHLTSPAVHVISCSSYLDDLWDGRWVVVQLLFFIGRSFQYLFKRARTIFLRALRLV